MATGGTHADHFVATTHVVAVHGGKASAIPHEMPTRRTMIVDARPYVPGRALPRQILARGWAGGM